MTKVFIAWKTSERGTSYGWFEEGKGPQRAYVTGIYPARYVEVVEGDDEQLLKGQFIKDGYTIRELD